MDDPAPPKVLAGSVRSPRTLGTFFAIGIGAAALEFAMAIWAPAIVPDPPGLALFLAVVTVVALAACTRNVRPAFLGMGLAVCIVGLLAGFQVLRLAYFAFASVAT